METSLSSDPRVSGSCLTAESGTSNTAERYQSPQTDLPIGAGSASATQMGRHKSLGFAQIVLGVFFIICWTPLILRPVSMEGKYRIQWWIGLSFVLCGFIWHTVEKTISTVRFVAYLIMNTVSALVAVASVIQVSMNLHVWTTDIVCYSGNICDSWSIALARYRLGLIIALFLLAFLELVISIIILIFGCPIVSNKSKTQHNKPRSKSTDQESTSQMPTHQDTTYSNVISQTTL
ncbi:uncharacterized protein LOC122544136 [Chiloscyllium plagiosum]|uniref:uncharacterized protein LOC122544136 n=1 Tax=Chiloscyllium plagiosum TaxID=36176 RepID=UPI001CB82C76|nr:uncharacterized protein LOC122544136 [Chiloscyllium plagiosum]XP_043539112.1 uncharacterized protein LOC122544136 [Chiloscyllium plagiosum]